MQTRPLYNKLPEKRKPRVYKCMSCARRFRDPGQEQAMEIHVLNTRGWHCGFSALAPGDGPTIKAWQDWRDEMDYQNELTMLDYYRSVL